MAEAPYPVRKVAANSMELADYYGSWNVRVSRTILSPDAWQTMKDLTYEVNGNPMLWGNPVEVQELLGGAWAEVVCG